MLLKHFVDKKLSLWTTYTKSGLDLPDFVKIVDEHEMPTWKQFVKLSHGMEIPVEKLLKISGYGLDDFEDFGEYAGDDLENVEDEDEDDLIGNALDALAFLAEHDREVKKEMIKAFISAIVELVEDEEL